ncbi:MAG TPA: hypothetical protein PLJ21_12375 [Pseudobdellovibrionaceae bacterium]|nr:hypothetical protein [Pseudobdellovibrionaceae bacterium]
MKSIICIFLVIFNFNFSYGKDHVSNVGKNILGPGPEEMAPPGLIQSGQLFTVKVVPFDKEAKIYIVGKENVKINWQGTDLEATLQLPQGEKKITLIKGKDHFLIKESIKGNLDLKLQSKPNTTVEKFRFKLD